MDMEIVKLKLATYFIYISFLTEKDHSIVRWMDASDILSKTFIYKSMGPHSMEISRLRIDRFVECKVFNNNGSKNI